MNTTSPDKTTSPHLAANTRRTQKRGFMRQNRAKQTTSPHLAGHPRRTQSSSPPETSKIDTPRRTQSRELAVDGRRTQKPGFMRQNDPKELSSPHLAKPRGEVARQFAAPL